MPAPKQTFDTIAEVFEAALSQEQDVSRQIDALYELAFREKAFSATVELQWFLTEQVEEEKSAREIVAKFRLVGNDPASLLDLDRELLAGRHGIAGAAAPPIASGPFSRYERHCRPVGRTGRLGSVGNWGGSVAYLGFLLVGYHVTGTARRHHVESAWYTFGAIAIVLAVLAGKARRPDSIVDVPQRGRFRERVLIAMSAVAASALLYFPSLSVGLLSDDFVLLEMPLVGGWEYVRPVAAAAVVGDHTCGGAQRPARAECPAARRERCLGVLPGDGYRPRVGPPRRTVGGRAAHHVAGGRRAGNVVRGRVRRDARHVGAAVPARPRGGPLGELDNPVGGDFAGHGTRRARKPRSPCQRWGVLLAVRRPVSWLALSTSAAVALALRRCARHWRSWHADRRLPAICREGARVAAVRRIGRAVDFRRSSIGLRFCSASSCPWIRPTHPGLRSRTARRLAWLVHRCVGCRGRRSSARIFFRRPGSERIRATPTSHWSDGCCFWLRQVGNRAAGSLDTRLLPSWCVSRS